MRKLPIITFLLFFIGVISCGNVDDSHVDFGIELFQDSVLNDSLNNQDDQDDSTKTSKTESSEYIAIFGDIQYTTNRRYISIYKNSIDWILNQSRSGKKINCVLHTGDITQSNSITQWQCFYNATKELAQEIPYFSMIGDHDYSWDGALINDRKSTMINDYVKFPLSTEKVVAFYEEGRMENIVVKNYIHGLPIYLLVLEFGPRKEVVEWADDYVKAHRDIRFLLMNHEYLEKGGGRRTKGLKCVARLRNTTYTTPEQLWNNLVKCNDNIRVVLCGHVGGLYALTIDTNDFGREIPQIQHNIQSPDFRYDNWLMLWEFPANDDSVNVSIINTKTLEFYNNKSTLFRFRYRR